MTQWWRGLGRRTRWLFMVFVLLVLASHIVQYSSGSMWTPPENNIGSEYVGVTVPGDRTWKASTTIRLSYLARGPENELPPIILLHGSPGQAYDYALARDSSIPSFLDRLAGRGRRVYAVDQPGFGNSQPWVSDYSSKAYARSLLAMMDALDIERAHVVCWSNSGGAGLWMCDLSPDRVASLTMLAAVGAQETEGSGSYWFEHAKYALGLPFVVGLPEVLPHFGRLGPTSLRYAFIRSFLDTDQRPLGDIMRRTAVPTLILHGRHDFLIADWAAEYHHELMPSSRLVMLDGMHFLPFLHPQVTADEILAHAARHDQPGVPPLTDNDNRAPRVLLPGPVGLIQHIGEHVRWWPWWVLVLIFTLCAWRKPETATMAAALWVATNDVDFGVAIAGLSLGRLLHGREMPGEHRAWWVARSLAWALASILLASVLGGVLLGQGELFGGWLIVPGFVLGVLTLRLMRHIWTPVGRSRILASITRTLNHEWWPTWALYLPTMLSVPVFAMQHRGWTVFSACNPGIENGGGLVDESKSAIMNKLPATDSRVLRTEAIGPGTGERARSVLDLIDHDPSLGGYPIIIKPDTGQRGMGVRLAGSPADIQAFLASYTGGAVLQRFHPGPHEAGVFWVRQHKRDDPRPIHERDGFITSITLKRFQYLDGDGRRTIKRLIIEHPRYRCQMRLFFDRFADRLDEVLPVGERIPLSFMGNHAQGTRFDEGGHLATPALERSLNELARSFADDGFDYGRFDIRYADEASLTRGEGFAVIELNGTTSEPTNIYDPTYSPIFAWRSLRQHWGHMYRIGRERVEAGAPALSPGALIRLVFGPNRGP